MTTTSLVATRVDESGAHSWAVETEGTGFRVAPVHAYDGPMHWTTVDIEDVVEHLWAHLQPVGTHPSVVLLCRLEADQPRVLTAAGLIEGQWSNCLEPHDKTMDAEALRGSLIAALASLLAPAVATTEVTIRATA